VSRNWLFQSTDPALAQTKNAYKQHYGKLLGDSILDVGVSQ
jgi:hypothetical protein